MIIYSKVEEIWIRVYDGVHTTGIHYMDPIVHRLRRTAKIKINRALYPRRQEYHV